MTVKNAVNLSLEMNAYSDADLCNRLKDLVTQFELYGVRSFIDSSLGIVYVERRNVTPEQYRAAINEAAERIRKAREGVEKE